MLGRLLYGPAGEATVRNAALEATSYKWHKPIKFDVGELLVETMRADKVEDGR